MDLFHSILDIFSHLELYHFLLLVFAAYFVENIFPPLPGDTMLVFSAYVFGLYHYNDDIIWLYLASVLGAVTGFMMMVLIGRHFGRQFIIERNYKYASRVFFEKVDNYFLRYGWGVVLGNRLFFGMRPVIGLAAGMSQMHRGRILFLVTISAFVFNAGFILLGKLLGQNWPLIEDILRKYTGLTIILTVILLLLILRYVLKKRKNAKKK